MARGGITIVLQTHICKWQEMSKKKEIKLGSHPTPKQVRRGSQPPRHSSGMATELQAAECSADSLGTESLAKSPITTRHCAYRNIYTSVFQ